MLVSLELWKSHPHMISIKASYPKNALKSIIWVGPIKHQSSISSHLASVTLWLLSSCCFASSTHNHVANLYYSLSCPIFVSSPYHHHVSPKSHNPLLIISKNIKPLKMLNVSNYIERERERHEPDTPNLPLHLVIISKDIHLTMFHVSWYNIKRERGRVRFERSYQTHNHK